MTQVQIHRGDVPEWDVADRMTKALRHSGISVSAMAAAMGVSRETIGRWINGRGKPGRAALIAWASLTGVDLAWLEGLPCLDSNQEPSGLRLALVSGGAA